MNKKVSAYIVAALIAVAGIVFLFVLESKILGILLILLAAAFGFTVFNQIRHPEKDGDVFDKAALFRDRFHRVRNTGGNDSHE